MGRATRATYAWELLWRHSALQVRRQGGWLAVGIIGPLVITLAMLLRPFDLRSGLDIVQRTAVLFAAWYVGFALLHILNVWLAHRPGEQQHVEAHLPLPAGQFFLHRAVEQSVLPLLTGVLTLPLFWVVLTYIGLPYGEDPGVRQWRIIGDWEDWASSTEPWGLRAMFLILILAACTLLPLALGAVLQEAVEWVPGRCVLLLAVPTGAFFLIRIVGEDCCRGAYRQTRGISPWPFLAVFIALLVVPFLIGVLSRRGRMILLIAAAIIALSLLALPMVKHQLPGVRTAAMRVAYLDAKYALGYFLGHLSPKENIDLVLHSYSSNVLTNNRRVGDMIPQHVALWVGAGVYPLGLPLLAFALLWLGITMRPRRAQ